MGDHMRLRNININNFKYNPMTLQDKIHHANEIANAIQRGATTYTYDNASLSLPAPQVAGTMTQQRSYAMGKAMELIEHLTRI